MGSTRSLGSVKNRGPRAACFKKRSFAIERAWMDSAVLGRFQKFLVRVQSGVWYTPPTRPKESHPHDYGAFVLDPDGHNIEAVCHTAE